MEPVTGFRAFDTGRILDETHMDGDGDTIMEDDIDPDTYDRPCDYDRLLIAVDFGTTFSSVAYVRIPAGTRPGHLGLRSVQCIDRYPDYIPPFDASPLRRDVPTEMWYNTGQDYSAIGSDTQEEEEEESSADDSESADSSSDEEEVQANRRQAPEKNTSEVEAVATQKPRCWGFGVQNQLEHVDIPKDNAGRLARFKLLLDNSDATTKVRESLGPILRSLRCPKRRFIRNELDLFIHYFTHLLENAKDQLQSMGQLTVGIVVEFVLCVPAKWPTKGSRILQTAMQVAVEKTGLANPEQRDMFNLFIVCEPEAAAACTIVENEESICFGDVVTILDAGGGTVDAVTYNVDDDEPLRMRTEVVPPESALCGGSFINQRFEKLLLKKLQNEEYLVKNGKTIKSIAEAKTILFENREKRSIDVENDDYQLAPIYIDDLRENKRKGFSQNRLKLTKKETRKLFKKSLKRTRELLERQLEAAEARGYPVKKVILTGGFAKSPSLQHYLKNFIQAKVAGGADISLLTSPCPSTAVVRGAILRALRREKGPARETQCSYGFLITEPHEPEECEAHKHTKPRIDKVDGEKYVKDTISWCIDMGDILPPRHEVRIKNVKHTFSVNAQRLLCKEVLWVSDQKHDSHYRKSHVKNKGAEPIGTIVADMTFLRDNGLIHPEPPSEFSSFAGDKKKGGRMHLTVQFDLVMIVEGLNLKYEARWPPKDKQEEGQLEEAQATGRVCIAAAFQPGTV